eukprot:gnl/TRDRNA2_/TRDRNA2_29258_c0_seq1.p1 gnl/TRDRNA2_/TRDRNA2_29258_c0~~gnl/TRDRNA2_/TRDRNA2_29258_c0_seq1.p1  ORF type:complete len:478 (-),score=94.59 gnl/TRDRNA2_/TRDRNA2_29258_c0_seq1:55-1488(-)
MKQPQAMPDDGGSVGKQLPPPSTKAVARMRLKAVVRAVQHFQAGDLVAFYETLTLSVFQSARVSVSLADPSLPDCPLVAISHGFERLTGYHQSEVIGRNCRFLNVGCPIPTDVRMELRLAARSGIRAVACIRNRRKNGEYFDNLLQLISLRIANKDYVMGLQADVTGQMVTACQEERVAMIDRLIEEIFTAGMETISALQAVSFGTLKELDILPPGIVFPEQPHRSNKLKHLKEVFGALSDAEGELVTKNTFLEVTPADTGESAAFGAFPRVSSEPNLSAMQASDQMLLGSAALRDCNALGGAPVSRQSAPPESPTARQSKLADTEDGVVATTNVGGHPTDCTPCQFFCYSLAGCSKGSECSYCHLDHPRRKWRQRGKKKKKNAKPQDGAPTEDFEDDKEEEPADAAADSRAENAPDALDAPDDGARAAVAAAAAKSGKVVVSKEFVDEFQEWHAAMAKILTLLGKAAHSPEATAPS